jgi:hypothetical protein
LAKLVEGAQIAPKLSWAKHISWFSVHEFVCCLIAIVSYVSLAPIELAAYRLVCVFVCPREHFEIWNRNDSTDRNESLTLSLATIGTDVIPISSCSTLWGRRNQRNSKAR